MKLTDEDLTYLLAKHPPCCSDPRCADKMIPSAIAELRELRALLATPNECGFDLPRVDAGVNPPLVVWGALPDEETYERRDAIAIGAAFIRAALQIPEDK